MPASIEAAKVAKDPGLTAADHEDLLDPTTQLLSTDAFNKYFARYGNDSFAIILPKANLTNATQVAERVRAGVKKLTITLAKDELNFTISIGAGEERRSDGSAPLIDRVKRAVAIAAIRGGNQTVASDSESFDRVAFDSPHHSPAEDNVCIEKAPPSQPIINAFATATSPNAPMSSIY